MTSFYLDATQPELSCSRRVFALPLMIGAFTASLPRGSRALDLLLKCLIEELLLQDWGMLMC